MDEDDISGLKVGVEVVVIALELELELMVECEVELVMGLELDIIVEPEVTAAVDEEDMLLAIWLNKEDMLEEDTLLDEGDMLLDEEAIMLLLIEGDIEVLDIIVVLELNESQVPNIGSQFAGSQ